MHFRCTSKRAAPCAIQCGQTYVRQVTPRTSCCGADRRALLLAPCVVTLLLAPAAEAFQEPPQGYSQFIDKLEGYSFIYPANWPAVSSTGNDVFRRNPRVPDENVFVNISSPSSSNFSSVADLGSPEDASKRMQQQFLKEYMSTRIGVRREVEPIFARSRIGDDGKTYYDVGVRVQSYASRQQLAAGQSQRDTAIEKEFDRALWTTLGVANKQIYQLRMQAPFKRFEKDSSLYDYMASNFRCTELET